MEWFDDWWTVKPNEFERGVLTGMLLKCGKSSGGSGSYENVDLIADIAKIKTWVSMDNAWYWSYYGLNCEDWYLHQTITYSDGTVREWKSQLSRYIMGKGTLIKGEFSNWYFNAPDEHGVIKSINWIYTNSDGSFTQSQRLEWYIPTTTPEVITV